MESRAKIFGHPMHPMLVVFPFGLLATAVIFDLAGALGGIEELHIAAYWMIIAGIAGGLAAAIPGAIDLLAIPRHTRAFSIGLLHGAGNAFVLVIFAISWWLREAAYDPGSIPIVLDVIAFGLACVTGWLGGELVDRLGVGVDDGAHLDAPSSLSGRSAREAFHDRRPVRPTPVEP